MIFVAPNVFSQKLVHNYPALLPLQQPLKPIPTTLLLKRPAVAPASPQPFLSGNYYASQLGFFCRQEIKFEKISKIPFKFRLGSVEDCDKMEGKKKAN